MKRALFRTHLGTKSVTPYKNRTIFPSTVRIIAFPFALVTTAPLFSQTQPPIPAERETTTYLDRQIAARKIDTLKVQVKTDIFRLYKLQKNMGAQVSGAQELYQRIRGLYQKGMDSYYKREVIESYNALKDARSLALDLYQKYSDYYEKQLSELLATCSESLVNLEMESSVNPDQGYLLDDIAQNHYKLKIAYNEVATANRMKRDNRYDTAVEHFRIAKLYAIHVIKALETNPEKKAALDAKYRIDIIDAMGGVSGKGTSSQKEAKSPATP